MHPSLVAYGALNDVLNEMLHRSQYIAAAIFVAERIYAGLLLTDRQN